MKVLKKLDISNWSYKHMCVNCESELEIESSDLRCMKENTPESFTAMCAVCGSLLFILEKNIPKLIQIVVKNKHEKSDSSDMNDYFVR